MGDPSGGRGPRKFAFVAHFVEWWTYWLQFSTSLNANPALAAWWRLLTPFNALMSFLYRVGERPFERVDAFRFAGVPGETYCVRNFAVHYVRKRNHRKIRERICQTVLAAQEGGAEVIGIGALNKAEWLTRGGAAVVEELASKGLLREGVSVIHGDTLTAAVVLRQAIALADRLGIRGRPVFVIGATSKIGRPVTLGLARVGLRARMLTGNRKRFEAIRAEAGPAGALVEAAGELEGGKDCALWITGKADPGGRELLANLPQRAVVLNFSVPDPLLLAGRRLRTRPDVLHLDGGLVAYDPAVTDLTRTIRLVPGLTYACHAETIVRATMGWSGHDVGAVDAGRMEAALAAALQVGFRLPPWTSFLEPVAVPGPAAPAEPEPQAAAVS